MCVLAQCSLLMLKLGYIDRAMRCDFVNFLGLFIGKIPVELWLPGLMSSKSILPTIKVVNGFHELSF